MPSTRSKKPLVASAATKKSPAISSTRTPAAHRKRATPKQFDAGVNPISEKRKKKQQQPKRPVQKPSTKAPATRRKSPEAPQSSQFAADVQAQEIVIIDEDEGVGIEDNADPLPEDGVAASDLVDNYEAYASVRYRAAFNDGKPVLGAADSQEGVRVRSIMLGDVWRWVDRIVDELQPRTAAVVNLCATVYPYNQHKGDRRQKTITRADYTVWGAFQHLAKHVGFNNRLSGKVLYVDFDLILADIGSQQPPQPPQQQQQPASPQIVRTRPMTATMIQERGLAAVLANEQAATGNLLGLMDRWRCTDSHCSNYGKQCWVPQLGNRIARFEDHHPVPSNIIGNWLEDVDKDKCTIEAPSDRVKLALFHQKRELVAEKKRVTKPPTLDEQLRQMLTMQMMREMRALGGSSQSIERLAHETAEEEARSKPEWEDIEYEDWGEIVYHTGNFLHYLKRHMNNDTVDEIKRKVLIEAHLDINMMMSEEQENGISIAMWVNHFKLQPGDLFQLRRRAKMWQQNYNGLSEKQLDRVREYSRRRKARTELEEDGDASDGGVLTEI